MKANVPIQTQPLPQKPESVDSAAEDSVDGVTLTETDVVGEVSQEVKALLSLVPSG